MCAKGGVMDKKYILNVTRHTLHYKGLCHITRDINGDKDNYKCYVSENEAKANNAINIGWCQLCSKKRT